MCIRDSHRSYHILSYGHLHMVFTIYFTYLWSGKILVSTFNTQIPSYVITSIFIVLLYTKCQGKFKRITSLVPIHDFVMFFSVLFCTQKIVVYQTMFTFLCTLGRRLVVVIICIRKNMFKNYNLFH